MKRIFGVPVADYALGAGLFLFTVIYLIAAYGYEAEARAFPAGVAWVMLAISALDLILVTDTKLAAVIRRIINPVPGAAVMPVVSVSPRPIRTQAVAIMWIFTFAALLVLVGILYAVPIYVFASMRFYGRLSYRLSLSVAAGTVLMVWLLFAVVLRLDLYSGVFFADF